MAKPESLPGLRRGTTILENLASSPDGMTFGDIADLLNGVPSSTIARLLKVMADEQLIEKADGSRKYCMGARARRLGRMICGEASKQDLLQPVVDSLAEDTGESAAYYEFVEDHVIIIAKHEFQESFHYLSPGIPNRNFHINTFGKVCLAYQDDAAMTKALDNAKEQVDRPAFAKVLDTWRSQSIIVDRHAVSKRRQKFVTRFVAPVQSDSGKFTGAIGVTATGEFDDTFRRLAIDAVVSAAQAAGTTISQIKQNHKATS